MSAASPSSASGMARRAPLIIVLCGCLIAMLTFGPRASSGIFLLPMTAEYGWGRDTFGLAIAIQNLLWGLGTPFAGAIADRYGVARVLCAGAVLYAAGLALMAYASTPGLLHLSAGVIVGFGLSGCSFNIVLAAFGKMLPDRWRPMAFGAGTAAGSFGQFLFPPLAAGLIGSVGWQETLIVFGGAMLMVMPLAVALMSPPRVAVASAEPKQTIGAALGQAFRHPSYVFLVLGFFTCGFQLAFVTTHLPAYLTDRGLSITIGGWTLAVIGLANMVGSLSSGWLSSRFSRRLLLAWIYFARGVVIIVFILLPASPITSIGFGIGIGLLWLSTVPPTSGLVMLMFGTRYLAMLYGFAFFSHQVGGFLGVWLGGLLYERLGSYDLVWWLSVALSFASAVINLPIVERPVAERRHPAAA
ncbi:MFS transporter [Ancylobacter defluvii]|uniref:MFS transporter n=1 Tax=Ancylobacter defluvii TaxID=1282440 RepID=A0A9W6JWS5_9HYPH|nr:MFS transporter [Ancylobacter defluvii]MBS7590423.1 MFS transporter [Ancylobacter defluvii]GLK83344.1 MFS transporter [Ancylobacter defluvii]